MKVEEESDGWYTDEWFKKEEERVSKKSKKTVESPSKKLNKAEEASSGESSQGET